MQLSQSAIVLLSLMTTSATPPKPEDMIFSHSAKSVTCDDSLLCGARRGDCLFPHAPAPSFPSQPKNTPARNVNPRVIREKELITEGEAGFLLSLSEKALGNRRRGNGINRALFIQNVPGGKVLYRRAELINASRKNAVFVRNTRKKK